MGTKCDQRYLWFAELEATFFRLDLSGWYADTWTQAILSGKQNETSCQYVVNTSHVALSINNTLTWASQGRLPLYSKEQKMHFEEFFYGFSM